MLDDRCILSVDEYERLARWFDTYSCGFLSEDEVYNRPLELKRVHTVRVCNEADDIASHQHCTAGQIRYARAAALLHDIGRFQQYVTYHTFSDRDSENHAVLGASIIESHGLLDGIDPVAGDVIVKAVRYHNRRDVPVDESETVLFFSRLLRDADKIDILNVLTSYYDNRHTTQDAAIEHGLPDTEGVSPEVRDAILDNRIVEMEHVRNLNDFKMFQLGWVSDFNFDRTREIILQRDYYTRIRAHLPYGEEVDAVYRHVMQRLARSGGIGTYLLPELSDWFD
jgi:putative nucleotidyltransferase with HDIG domain